jgi:hypothetical protein
MSVSEEGDRKKRILFLDAEDEDVLAAKVSLGPDFEMVFQEWTKLLDL